MQVPLKRKYLTAKKSRWTSTHQDSAKKTKKYSGGHTTVVYNRDDHVLYLKGGHSVFLHYADAHKLLGR